VRKKARLITNQIPQNYEKQIAFYSVAFRFRLFFRRTIKRADDAEGRRPESVAEGFENPQKSDYR
jgi:hypothetical protein